MFIRDALLAFLFAFFSFTHLQADPMSALLLPSTEADPDAFRGYNIHYVYNATHGLTGDTVEYLLGRGYVATAPVRLLHSMWNSFFETRSASAKFLMFCHSQGAIHVRNALLDYPTELRERITVMAIAPGAYIYQQTCAYVIHYRNESIKREFIPHLDWTGARRERGTIVDLVSHPDADRFDHGFQSLTYQRHLADRLNEFLGR